jgi:predicted transcriptional regulator
MIVPFLRERPASILLLLRDSSKEWYISSLSRNSGLTYPHTITVLEKYLNLGLIEYSTKGRKKTVILTEKGKKITSSLNDIVDYLNEE